jgi:hypothetical protein
MLSNFFSKGSKFGQKWPFLLVLNTGKYRQVFAGIGIWSPEYRTGIPVSVYTGLETLAASQSHLAPPSPSQPLLFPPSTFVPFLVNALAGLA